MSEAPDSRPPVLRLIFPCGAYFPVRGDDSLLEDCHRSGDGAFRIGVHPSSKPHLDEGGECLARVKKRSGVDYDGERAPCEFFCPDRRRRKEDRGYDTEGKLGKYISCFARLHLKGGDGSWNDITPPRPAKCPHCEEQRTYVQACRRAAIRHDEAPDRVRWRKCKCGRFSELLDSGQCALCTLVQVVDENRSHE